MSDTEAACPVCAAVFTPRASGKRQVYCSPACRNRDKARQWRASNPGYDKQFRKPPTVIPDRPCGHCGKPFTPTKETHLFCSVECQRQATAAINRIDATCWECGARFVQTARSQRYCLRCVQQDRSDRSERNEVKARLYKERKACEVCGEQFTAYRSTSRYCSKVCAGQASRDRVKQGLTGTLREVACEYCGTVFRQKNTSQRFCSRSCSDMRWHYSERGQDKKYWTSYRMRYEEVQVILVEQGNACAICKEPFGDSRKQSPHVDHDHSCCESVPTCGNCNRGLICGNCNTMLGMAQDDPTVLEQAVAYLRRGHLPGPASR
jgi:hypothetical protein